MTSSKHLVSSSSLCLEMVKYIHTLVPQNSTTSKQLNSVTFDILNETTPFFKVLTHKIPFSEIWVLISQFASKSLTGHWVAMYVVFSLDVVYKVGLIAILWYKNEIFTPFHTSCWYFSIIAWCACEAFCVEILKNTIKHQISSLPLVLLLSTLLETHKLCPKIQF